MDDVLEKAVEEYKPIIAKQYSDLVHRIFEQMVKKLGPTLKDVYNDWTWGRTYSSTMRNLIHICVPPNTYSCHLIDAADKILDEEKVTEAATKYADSVADALLRKIKEKVGLLDSASVHKMNADTFLISGKKHGTEVQIEQTMILNHSKLGTIFNQFPARIYLGGKFISAAKFKKL